MTNLTILQGDWIEQLSTLEDQSVQCCVTSPPYWGLRDYGTPGQLGLEPTPEAYVAKLVAGFAQVRRVLKNDGTLWLNLGDSYAASGCGWGGGSISEASGHHAKIHGTDNPLKAKSRTAPPGLKPKDLVGIPWMVAFALRAQGWYLRSDIIWAKPNPMPESVTDRPTRSHEYIFLLSKSQSYFYDAEAIKEPSVESDWQARYDRAVTGHKSNPDAKQNGLRVRNDRFGGNKHNGDTTKHSDGSIFTGSETRNKRTVWTVSPMPYQEAHFATFPPDLIKPCILAGSRPGDTILDPFAGSGTTGMVATELARSATLIELNPSYISLIHQRTNITHGLPLC